MKRLLVILIAIFSISFLFADENEVLLLPYNTTTLTPDQQAMNPTFVAYPTQLKNSIPQMKCNSELYGFTIDEQDHKVGFSPGNLQYQASTNKWRFAEHQWDFVGFADKGNVYENGEKCSNSLIGEDYSGWIDLFAWGTSGWPRKSGEYYYPTVTDDTHCNRLKYHINGNGYNSFETGSDNEKADWGVYNQIGQYPSGVWRTLSNTQWNYIINLRANANTLCGLGIVNGVFGLILLPDDWLPIGELSFNPSRDNASANNYSIEDWTLMEKHGAIFLPSASQRWERQENSGGGWYWSATANSNARDGGTVGCYLPQYSYIYYAAYCLYFYSGSIEAMFDTYRSRGLSVRLVRDIE